MINTKTLQKMKEKVCYTHEGGCKPKLEITHHEHGKISIRCCRFNRYFYFYLQGDKHVPELLDIIQDCLYKYCETGEISFQMPKRIRKGWTK